MAQQEDTSRKSDEPINSEPAESYRALEAEDFYFEGPNMVFTAIYHLKRGYCCNSGCRHCPYR